MKKICVFTALILIFAGAIPFVTATNVSLNLNNCTSTTWAIGSKATSLWTFSSANTSYFNVTNDGNVAEDINIEVSDEGASWTVNATGGPDADKFAIIASIDSFATNVTLSDSYQELKDNLAQMDDQGFDMAFCTPSATSTNAEQSITIRLQAVEHS